MDTKIMFNVSISIVTYNSKHIIEKCLESVFKQTYKRLEVLLIDNNSEDMTAEIVKNNFPKTKVYKLNKNIGYTGGHNFGIQMTLSEKYLLFLNPDIILHSNFIEQCILEIEKYKNVGMVSGKLINRNHLGNKHILDSTGLYVDQSGVGLDRGRGQVDIMQYDYDRNIFGVNGAALFCRKEMLKNINIKEYYFDPLYFMYYEDLDLAWRAQLYGWKALYVPTAIAWHLRGGINMIEKQDIELKRKIKSHLILNRYLTLIKNQNTKYLLRNFTSKIIYLVYAIIRNPYVICYLLNILFNINTIIYWRLKIMKNRKVSWSYMEKWLKLGGNYRKKNKHRSK